jgi:hypothetical protein
LAFDKKQRPEEKDSNSHVNITDFSLCISGNFPVLIPTSWKQQPLRKSRDSHPEKEKERDGEKITQFLSISIFHFFDASLLHLLKLDSIRHHQVVDPVELETRDNVLAVSAGVADDAMAANGRGGAV